MDGYEKRGKYWSKRYREIDTLTGKELHKRFSKDENGNKFLTLKDCKEAYQRFCVLLKNQQPTQAKIVYFKELYEKYLDYQKTKIRPSSIINLQYMFNAHILPKFGKMKLDQITPLVIHEWQISKDHFSYKYKVKMRGCFGQVLQYGAKYFGTTNNMPLVDGYSKSNMTKKEMSIWTPDEFKTFIECAEDFKSQVIFNFLYMMGTRKGEMCALKWTDIDFSNKTCSINKTLTRESGGAVIGNSTKNSKHRVLAIPSLLLEQLKKLKNIKKNSPNFKNTDFVFGGKCFLSFTTLLSKYEQILAIAQKKNPTLKRIRIHDFRHSHVSLLINKASSNMSLSAMLYSIAERLGDNVEQVLKTYGHLFPNAQKDLVATLDNL